MKMKKPYVIGLLCILFVAASAFVIWFSLGATNQQQEIRGQAYTTGGTGGTGSTGTGGTTGGTGSTGAGGSNTNSGGGSSNSGTGTSTASCSENQVNVQFRVWTGEDKPWVDGSAIKLKAGDYVDVNCFAKTGTALLQNPVMTATLTASGSTTAVALPNANTAEIRKLAITKGGVYTFTCHNTSNTCTDTDKFTVPVTATACKRGGCSNQLCVPSTTADITSTCEFKAEYACYQQAECKVQADGQCGFTPSDTLNTCLAAAGVSPSPAASTTPGAGGTADLNGDGVIDIFDYAIFYTAYMQNSGL